MRLLIGMSITLMLILAMSSCATTKIELPQKYMLDNQLESVKKVSDVRMGKSPTFTEFEESFEDPQTVMARRDTVTFSEAKNQWDKVDEQSFMLRATSGNYYLLVLNVPAVGLMSTDTISFQLLTNTINARMDFLELNGVKYLVEKIYKITSSEQMYAIKNQLTQK